MRIFVKETNFKRKLCLRILQMYSFKCSCVYIETYIRVEWRHNFTGHCISETVTFVLNYLINMKQHMKNKHNEECAVVRCRISHCLSTIPWFFLYSSVIFINMQHIINNERNTLTTHFYKITTFWQNKMYTIQILNKLYRYICNL